MQTSRVHPGVKSGRIEKEDEWAVIEERGERCIPPILVWQRELRSASADCKHLS